MQQVNNLQTDNVVLKKLVEERVSQLVPKLIAAYLQGPAFSKEKLTDTPTDSRQVVNRGYVTLNGTSASRPVASVVGQQYLDMTLASGRGKPIYWNGTGFIDANGDYV